MLTPRILAVSVAGLISLASFLPQSQPTIDGRVAALETSQAVLVKRVSVLENLVASPAKNTKTFVPSQTPTPAAVTGSERELEILNNQAKRIVAPTFGDPKLAAAKLAKALQGSVTEESALKLLIALDIRPISPLSDIDMLCEASRTIQIIADEMGWDLESAILLLVGAIRDGNGAQLEHSHIIKDAMQAYINYANANNLSLVTKLETYEKAEALLRAVLAENSH